MKSRDWKKKEKKNESLHRWILISFDICIARGLKSWETIDELYLRSFHFHPWNTEWNNTFDPWITKEINISYILIDDAPLINDIFFFLMSRRNERLKKKRNIRFNMSPKNYFKDNLNSYVNSIIAFLHHFLSIFQSYLRRTLIKFFRHPLLSFYLMRINNYTEWSHYFWQRLHTRVHAPLFYFIARKNNDDPNPIFVAGRCIENRSKVWK